VDAASRSPRDLDTIRPIDPGHALLHPRRYLGVHSPTLAPARYESCPAIGSPHAAPLDSTSLR
jgi:hypothetical protein